MEVLSETAIVEKTVPRKEASKDSLDLLEEDNHKSLLGTVRAFRMETVDGESTN